PVARSGRVGLWFPPPTFPRLARARASARRSWVSTTLYRPNSARMGWPLMAHDDGFGRRLYAPGEDVSQRLRRAPRSCPSLSACDPGSRLPRPGLSELPEFLLNLSSNSVPPPDSTCERRSNLFVLSGGIHDSVDEPRTVQCEEILEGTGGDIEERGFVRRPLEQRANNPPPLIWRTPHQIGNGVPGFEVFLRLGGCVLKVSSY